MEQAAQSGQTSVTSGAATQPQPEFPAQDRVKILLVDDTPDNLVSLEAAPKLCVICWTPTLRPSCWT